MYLEILTFLMKKFATDPAMAEFDTAVLRYMQPANMTTQQYADVQLTNTCKVVDMYDESTLKDVFIGGMDLSIRHSLRQSWAQNPQADVAEIEFQAKSLLSIQKDANFTSTSK